MKNRLWSMAAVGIVAAGGLVATWAAAQQAAAPPAPPALYGGPAFPTCIVKAPTDCKLPNGKPDLTGLWAAGNPGFGGGGGNLASGAATQNFGGRGGGFDGFEGDVGLVRLTNDYFGPGAIQYKPEKWEAVIEADYNGNFEDPAQRCFPNGLPRMGAPAAIIAVKDQPFVLLIYTLREVRLIPTDGRPHNLTNVAYETWNGDSVGKWEGDTLVIETIGFTDASWLGKSGMLHGFNMKVTERLTRTGNQLRWEATVEDPEWLAQPWKLAPVTRTLATDPNATLYEPLPCDDIDRLTTTSRVR
jgi:hypothetical protein